MNDRYNRIACNYLPGGNNDPYRDYWTGANYIRRWTGINMGGNRIEHEVSWTVKEQRQGGVWLIHSRWKDGQKKFNEMLKSY